MAVPPEDLKAGLEVHQQLDTRQKLFCRCPTRTRDPAERSVEFLRLLRPTAGEAGAVDVAALEESRRARRFRYLGYDTTCLVEYDEEPPRELNIEALEAALQAALLLGMAPVEEVHVMRKAVLDGSNTTGFQRTALVATGGSVETSSGGVRLTTLCLEEDAAAIVGQEGDTVLYSLDRLGIPLVEIATEPDIRSPAQAREVARHIGMVLRSTGLAKRGLGSVRQDVNVSIAGGARVEIKGVQELRLVERTVAAEAERQARLQGLRGHLDSASVESRDSALLLRGWAPWDSWVAPDLRALAAKYRCRAIVEPSGGDLKIGVEGARAGEVVGLLAGRARLLLSGVPEETRRALEDGSTEFLRPLPGAARMYPETDVHPVLLTPALLDPIRRNLPELLETKQKRLMERYGLNEELAVVALERADLFEAWMKDSGTSPTAAIRALTALEKLQPFLEETRALRNILVHSGPLLEQQRDLEPLLKQYQLLLDVFENSKILEQARALRNLLVHSGPLLEQFRNLKPLMEQYRRQLEQIRDFQPLVSQFKRLQEALPEFERLQPLLSEGSDKEARAVVERIVREGAALVREKGEAAHGPLMGLAMKELRGKADGALVARLLKESIAALLKQG